MLSLSSAFMRRLARTPLRRRVALPARALSSSAPMLRQKVQESKDPYTPTALASLLARLSLSPTPELQKTVLACLTHPSFIEPEARAEKTGEQDNEMLANLGNTLLGLFATEEIATRYPHLPSNALSSAVTAFVGPASLVAVGRELGISTTRQKSDDLPANTPLNIPIRWNRRQIEAPVIETPVAPGFRENKPSAAVEAANRRKETWQEGVASVVRAFVGLVYQEQGMHAAREFVQAHFMSRHVDMSALFNFKTPKYMLSALVSKHLADAGVPGAESHGRIESRVLASSGVNTQAPVFNIGLFLPNGLKLAEGHGSSLSMAEHRAATNALLSLFLVKDRENLPLPTSVHAERPLSSSSAVASSAEEKTFRPHVGIVGLREPVEGLGKAMRTRN